MFCEGLKRLFKGHKNATIAVWLMLLAIISMLVMAILLFIIVNICQPLSGKHFEIILTFVGVIGTFVVVTNFYQAAELKREFNDAVEDTTRKYVDFDNKYRAAVDGIKALDVYQIAEQIVRQTYINETEKELCHIYHKCPKPMISNCYQYSPVHIEKVEMHDDVVVITFKESSEKFWKYPNDDIVALKFGGFFEPKECRLNNPMLQSFIRSMLKNKEQNINASSKNSPK